MLAMVISTAEPSATLTSHTLPTRKRRAGGGNVTPRAGLSARVDVSYAGGRAWPAPLQRFAHSARNARISRTFLILLRCRRTDIHRYTIRSPCADPYCCCTSTCLFMHTNLNHADQAGRILPAIILIPSTKTKKGRAPPTRRLRREYQIFHRRITPPCRGWFWNFAGVREAGREGRRPEAAMTAHDSIEMLEEKAPEEKKTLGPPFFKKCRRLLGA